MSKRLRNGLFAAAAIAALAGGGAAIAGATGDDDDSADTPITGGALDRAREAALDHTGGGTVTGTEVGDEESYYEVEVTKGGSQTDVQLDRGFNVVGDEADSESSGDDD